MCGYSGVQANANLYRPYQGWAQIYDQELGANSNYNSLQVSLRTTEWHHLTFAEAYTWSHAFDIIDGEIFSAVGNPNDTRWDRGQAGFDRRQISVTSIIYKFPFLRNSPNPFLKTGLGGWELSAIYTIESGAPFNVGYGPDNLGFGGGTGNRANIVAPVSYTRTLSQWFSTSSFAAPAALQWSNQQRNDLVGPQTNAWNMALYKQFQVRENARFEFRAESFNTFNHPNWSNPGSSGECHPLFPIWPSPWSPALLGLCPLGRNLFFEARLLVFQPLYGQLLVALESVIEFFALAIAPFLLGRIPFLGCSFPRLFLFRPPQPRALDLLRQLFLVRRHFRFKFPLLSVLGFDERGERQRFFSIP